MLSPLRKTKKMMDTITQALSNALSPQASLYYGISPMECELHTDIHAPSAILLSICIFTLLYKEQYCSDSVAMPESSYKDEVG